jgi:hypothetical protein
MVNIHQWWQQYRIRKALRILRTEWTYLESLNYCQLGRLGIHDVSVYAGTYDLTFSGPKPVTPIGVTHSTPLTDEELAGLTTMIATSSVNACGPA